jgi:hypothetical protein
MFNEDVLKKLISDFGEIPAMLYCKMESARNSYLFEECVKTGADNTCTQYDYERDWWKDAENKLSDNIKI